MKSHGFNRDPWSNRWGITELSNRLNCWSQIYLKGNRSVPELLLHKTDIKITTEETKMEICIFRIRGLERSFYCRVEEMHHVQRQIKYKRIFLQSTVELEVLKF